MKEIKESVVVKCNGVKELIECRKKLIEIGFNDRRDWNDEQVNYGWYMECPDDCFMLLSEGENNIQIHNHACCQVTNKMIQYSNLSKYLNDVYGVEYPKLNNYHFVWFPDERSIFSKGETISAYSMLEALVEFERRHNTEPYYVTQKK